MNERAEQDREMLFAALEMFVNCGDTASDLRNFRLQHPHFFWQDFYEQSEQLASAAKNDNFFNWLKRQLRSVWENRDPYGTRLAVLLGIKEVGYYGPAEGDFQAEVTEYMAILSDLVWLRGTPTEDRINLAANLRFPAQVTPDWRGGQLRYEPTIPFQAAVYTLMNESWRTRVCPVDQRYMIARKPANIYCSTKCSGVARRKRDLEYWRSEGDARRQERDQNKKHKSRGKK